MNQDFCNNPATQIFRQLNVMDETYVINQVKEDSCYVASNFKEEMRKSVSKTNDIVRDYVLPDFTTIKRGYLKSQEESTGRVSDGEQVT